MVINLKYKYGNFSNSFLRKGKYLIFAFRAPLGDPQMSTFSSLKRPFSWAFFSALKQTEWINEIYENICGFYYISWMSKIDITLYVHMWIPLATKTFCLKHFSNALSTFEFLHSNVNFWISPTHCQLLNFSNALSTFEFLQSTVNF